MFEIREEKTYLYLDDKSEDFSNLAAGILTRGLGKGIKIAYIDSNNTAKKLTNFIENLSLSYSFMKNLNISSVGIFTPKNDKIITKTLIPQVEYLNITKDMFFKDLLQYDLIIFDNLSFENFEKIKIISLIKNKNFNTQIITITNKEEIFKELEKEFDKKIKISYKTNNSLTKVNGVTTIYGTKNGKSVYAYGVLIRSFLYKADVKLIYFNKPEDYYGDVLFFKNLKKWQIENTLYGTLDYVQTGVKDSNDNIMKEKEANEALMLLETALKKKSPVIADEILNLLEDKTIDIDKTLDIIFKTKNQLILTGDNIDSNIKNVSQNLIKLYYNE